MPKKKKRGRPKNQLYEWNKWLEPDGLPVTLTKGKHYKGDQEIFVRQIRNAAKRRGFRVSLVTDDGSIIIKELIEREG